MKWYSHLSCFFWVPLVLPRVPTLRLDVVVFEFVVAAFYAEAHYFWALGIVLYWVYASLVQRWVWPGRIKPCCRVCSRVNSTANYWHGWRYLGSWHCSSCIASSFQQPWEGCGVSLLCKWKCYDLKCETCQAWIITPDVSNRHWEGTLQEVTSWYGWYVGNSWSSGSPSSCSPCCTCWSTCGCNPSSPCSCSSSCSTRAKFRTLGLVPSGTVEASYKEKHFMKLLKMRWYFRSGLDWCYISRPCTCM